MDFDSAIQEHATWKIKLRDYAYGWPREKLDATLVGQDNVCAFGQWLYGEGKSIMSERSKYSELVKLHAEFHHQAESLIKMIECGQAAQAKIMLGDRESAYGQVTLKVVTTLMELKAALK